jgi:hypothetical protein
MVMNPFAHAVMVRAATRASCDPASCVATRKTGSAEAASERKNQRVRIAIGMRERPKGMRKRGELGKRIRGAGARRIQRLGEVVGHRLGNERYQRVSPANPFV